GLFDSLCFEIHWNLQFCLPDSAIRPSDCSFSNGNDVEEGKEEEKVVASVIKVAPGVMELVEVAWKLDKLKWLLAKNPYLLFDCRTLYTIRKC
ncbi:hypothetical protein FRX31_016260, partial [Thalictrum thalictroides]